MYADARFVGWDVTEFPVLLGQFMPARLVHLHPRARGVYFSDTMITTHFLFAMLFAMPHKSTVETKYGEFFIEKINTIYSIILATIVHPWPYTLVCAQLNHDFDNSSFVRNIKNG